MEIATIEMLIKNSKVFDSSVTEIQEMLLKDSTVNSITSAIADIHVGLETETSAAEKYLLTSTMRKVLKEIIETNSIQK